MIFFGKPVPTFPDHALGASRLRCQAARLATGVTPTILAAVMCRRLPAMPDEPVIDTIGPTRHRNDNTIGRNRCAGIEIGRAVIVEKHIVRPGRVPVMMPDVHVRGE